MKEKSKGLLGVVVIAVVLIVGYFALSGGNSTTSPVVDESSDTITIGFMGALSGDVAFIGENVRAAVEIAVEEVNATGGIDGKMIEVIYEDSGCDSQMGASAANKLVNVDRVTAIIGPTCTPAALAAAPIAEEGGVPMISYSATAAAISDAGDYTFRTAPSDAFQAAFAADYIYNDLGKTRAVILNCLNDWCQGNADTFADNFEGEVLAMETFDVGATDIRSQISKVQAEDPDVVYLLAFPTTTVAGIAQMDELGLNETALIFGADVMSDPTIWDNLGELGNDVMYTEAASLEFADSFVLAMEAKLGEGAVVNVYAPRAYDAVMILAWAMDQAGVDREMIKDTLYILEGYEGLADSYTFDENGDPSTASYNVQEVVDGEPTLVETR